MRLLVACWPDNLSKLGWSGTRDFRAADGRVIAPLCEMGASIVARDLTERRRCESSAVHCVEFIIAACGKRTGERRVAAGWSFCQRQTTVEEAVPTRNHMEKILHYFLVRTAVEDHGSIIVFGDQVPESRDFAIPGDISSAAFWLVAAAAQPRGHLLIRDVGLNDTRTALLAVLLAWVRRYARLLKTSISLNPGIVEVTGSPLKAMSFTARRYHSSLTSYRSCLLRGAMARGKTIIRQAGELRVKETDRIAAIAHNLRTMGVHVAELTDGLEIHGPAPLHGARVASFGDHRIAMAFAIAGLFADGETVVQDARMYSRVLPGFEMGT